MIDERDPTAALRTSTAGKGKEPMEVTMPPREKHDKSRKRKPDESDQSRPVRDVREDPAPNPDDDSQREKPLPETTDGAAA
jgi:hypothetical protein